MNHFLVIQALSDLQDMQSQKTTNEDVINLRVEMKLDPRFSYLLVHSK